MDGPAVSELAGSVGRHESWSDREPCQGSKLSSSKSGQAHTKFRKAERTPLVLARSSTRAHRHAFRFAGKPFRTCILRNPTQETLEAAVISAESRGRYE
jgi:hypothetical protein